MRGHLVLVGGGHAHAFVLERLQREIERLRKAKREPPATTSSPLTFDVTLVSPHPHATYSGMVPGWLAGHYTHDDIAIDMAALAAHAGVRWVCGEVTALDAARRTLTVQGVDGSNSSLGYDLVSLNVGSTLNVPAAVQDHAPHATWLVLRPLNALQQAWRKVLHDARHHPATHRTVHAAGGGAAATESVLAVLAALRHVRPDVRFDGTLHTNADDVLTTHNSAVRRSMRQALHQAGVQVHTRSDARGLRPNEADLVLWATGAEALRWPRDSGLALDDQGFVRVHTTMQSISHPSVFASGDACAWPTPLPKAGVMAVRMGPVLADNLLRAMRGERTLQNHAPRKHHLALLSTADHRAIVSYGPWSAEGAWAWRWKDRIDRRFVSRFSWPQT